MSGGARPTPPGCSRTGDGRPLRPAPAVLRPLLPLVLVLLLPGLTGCPGEGAEQLYETARLEERQNNPDHARELYEQILREFPDSPVAERARQRLEALDAGPAGGATGRPGPPAP